MRSKLLLALLSLLIWSCTDTLDVEVEEGVTRLVVEGRLVADKDDPGSDYQFIRLSNTAPYFENRQVPGVSGAVVQVTDLNTSQVFLFSESDATTGLYEYRGMVPVAGHTYELNIQYQGDTYMAIAEMLEVADIDRIAQVFEEETVFSDEGIKVIVDYTDPLGVENYYHWQTFRNDTLLVRPDVGNQFNLISADEFYDGLTVTDFEPSGDFSCVPGDMAVVKQYALSSEAYDYYRVFYEQAVGISPGFGDVVPATLRGNVENLTNPDLYPLGYFEASEVSIRQLRIQ